MALINCTDFRWNRTETDDGDNFDEQMAIDEEEIPFSDHF